MTQEIDKLMMKCEPLVQKWTSGIKNDFGNEVRQEMRLRIWRFIQNKYMNTDNDTPVDVFVGPLLCLIYKTSINEVIRFNKRKYGRFVSLVTDDKCNNATDNNNIGDQLVFNPDILERLANSSHDVLLELSSCLDDNEQFIVQYMLHTDNYGDNHESLMRQLGYTGKGAIRYILDKVFAKMRKHAELHDIDIKL